MNTRRNILASRRKHWSNRYQRKPGLEGTLIQAFSWIGLLLLTALMFYAEEGVNFNLWASAWIGQGLICLLASYFYDN